MYYISGWCRSYVLHINDEMGENRVSETQKAAQKKYDQKTKMISIKYTPADMSEYNRLKAYLDRTGNSVNSFLKYLIKDFFDTGRDREKNNKVISPIDKKRYEGETWCPFSYIDRENVQILFDLFGKNSMEKVLDEYFSIIEYEIDNIFEEKGCDMDDWIQSVKKRIDGYTDETGFTWENDEGLITGESEEALNKLLEDLLREI